MVRTQGRLQSHDSESSLREGVRGNDDGDQRRVCDTVKASVWDDANRHVSLGSFLYSITAYM